MARKKTASGQTLMRGSLVTLRRRCGKANCRCADGQSLHEAPALGVAQRGRTRMLMLTDAVLGDVAAATAGYRTALAELEAAGDAGRDALAARPGADKAAARTPRRGR